ncbi:MAG: hypothetical protein ACXVLZ_07960 [Acidimicrobiia bacterium]
MAGTTEPGYGTPNWELIRRWLTLPADEDGPFWALNLMRYRPVAAYADADATAPAVSGKEADDAYAPLGPLAAVGAVVAFHGDVLDQRAGRPAWDRVGIVRYPTRAAFFAMQQRDDFKDQHVHKEAGMEFTIVLSCLPAGEPGDGAAAGRLVLVVERGGGAPMPLDGVEEVVRFGVEGVIVGDDRGFDRARFVAVRDDGARDALTATADAAAEAHVLVVDRAIDRLVDSIVTAPGREG